MKKNFTLLLLAALSLLFSGAVQAQYTGIGLNGTNTSVTTTSSSIVPSTGDFTVEFWAYIPSTVAGSHEFVSQGGTAGSNFYIGYDGAGNITAGDKWANTGVAMPVGQWAHIALVNASGTATLYINGAAKNSAAGYSITSGVTNFAIGVQYDGTGFINGNIDELKIWNVARTATQIKAGIDGVSTLTSGLVAYYKMEEGSGLTTANSTATSGLDGTLVNGPTWPSSPFGPTSNSNALTFDGVDDKIDVAPSPLWDGLSTATIEFMANPGFLGGFADVIGVRGVLGTKFSFHLASTGPAMANGSSFNTSLAYTFTNGTWYHVAFVVDGVMDTTGVFVNGAYIGKIPLGFGTATGLPLVMGVSENFGGDVEPYVGSLDEVRIWNTARTQAQIIANMNNSLSGTEPGLVALYGFDQGNPGGNNSFLTTALDGTANNNNGTLTNFALSGTASNFTSHLLVPLPVNFTSFTATPQGEQVLLKWQTAQELNSRDYTIERSSTGTKFTPIGSVAAAGNSSIALNYSFTDVAPLPGKNYYRLKETDLDNHSMYSIIRSINFGDLAGKSLVWFRTGDKAVEVDLKKGNNESYFITDMTGRLIQKGQLSSGKLFLNNAPIGMYSVRVVSASGAELTTKVLVQ